MDASAGSPHSRGNPPRQGGSGGGRGKAPRVEIRGSAAAADDFIFANDTFPSLPDFPCLSSPSSSNFSSSSSSNSSSAFTTAAGGGGEPSEPATAADGFDALADIDHLLDFASLSVPWDAEPLFPDEVGMMIEDAISGPTHRPEGDGAGGAGKSVLESAGAAHAGGACMGAEPADELPRFFMEWLTNNRECISAEDLRSIRLRRSTIEAAAARLGGGQQGTMQLLKLILTWVQNHHLQKKRSRETMEEGAAHGQLPSPGANPGYDFPSGASQEMGAAAATSWMPYQQAFTPPAAYGAGGEAMYPFQQSSSTSSVVVSTQPFSTPATDMHAASGANMAWTQQYAPFVAGSSTGGSYPMPPPPVVPHQQFTAGFAGQYAGAAAAAVNETSSTKEARKKRMARQRRLSCLQQQRSQQLNMMSQIQTPIHPLEPSPRAAHSAPVTPSGGWGSFWTTVGPVQINNNPLSKSNSFTTSTLQKPSPSSAPEEISAHHRSTAASDKRQGAKTTTDKNLRFLLQKVLKQSDVGCLGRIVLPKKEAEVHLPELTSRDGISIPMEDIGTSRVWNMRYRFWPNNKSRMYLLENTGDFVRSNELQEGDFIVIYADVKSGKYLIRGVKVRPPAPPAQEDGNTSAGAAGKHKHGGSDKAGSDGADDGGAGDAAGKPDGCKAGKSPHGLRRSRQQEAASMNPMAVSI